MLIALIDSMCECLSIYLTHLALTRFDASECLKALVAVRGCYWVKFTSQDLTCHGGQLSSPIFFYSLIMSELEQIKKDIMNTKADLEEAKRVGRSEVHLNNLLSVLVEQQKKENLLLAQSVPTPGKLQSSNF